MFAQVEEIRSREKDPSADTFQFTPKEQHFKELRGSLFVFIKNQSGEEAALSKNQALFQSLKEKFYGGSGSNLKALEEAIDAVKNEIGNSSFVAAVLWGSVLYLAKSGSGEAVLVRDGKGKKIDFNKIASGALRNNDAVLLLASELLEELDLGKLEKLIEKETKEINEELEKELGEKKASLLLLKLSIDEIREKPEAIAVEQLGEKLADRQDGKGINLVPAQVSKFKFDQTKIKNSLSAFWIFLKQIVERAKEIAGPYIKAGFTKLAEPWKKREPGNLDEAKGRQRARIIQVAAVLTIILAVSLLFGVVGKRGAEEKAKRDKTIADVKSKFENAVNLKDLNPSLAGEILADADKELKTLPAKDARVKELEKTYESIFADVNKIYQPTIKTVDDLTGAKSGTQAKSIAFSTGGLFVLDTGTKSVFKVGESSSQIVVSEKTGLQNIAAAGDFLYLQTDSGIDKIPIKNGQEQNLKSASGNWKKILSAVSYKNNLYLLDSKARQIWKYASAGETLSGPIVWLSETLKEEPIAFAVDGSVWVAFKTSIEKFSAGKKQTFEIKDQPKNFEEIVGVFTAENQANLYVLDGSVGGVFAIEKESGNYTAFYKNDRMKGASSLAVDENKKTLYFLNDNTIYSFNIK